MAGQWWWNSAICSDSRTIEVEVETATTEVVAALMLVIHVVTMAAELVLVWVAADEYG